MSKKKKKADTKDIMLCALRFETISPNAKPQKHLQRTLFSLQFHLKTCNFIKNNTPTEVFLKSRNEANNFKSQNASNIYLYVKLLCFPPFSLCFGPIFSWLVFIKVGSSSKVNIHLICLPV